MDGRSGGAREAKEEKRRSVWEEKKRKQGGESEAPSLSQRSKGRVDRSSREGGQNDAAEGRVLVQSDSELRGGSDGTVPGHRRRKMQPDAGGLDASKEAAEAGRCRGAGAAAFQSGRRKLITAGGRWKPFQEGQERLPLPSSCLGNSQR